MFIVVKRCLPVNVYCTLYTARVSVFKMTHISKHETLAKLPQVKYGSLEE